MAATTPTASMLTHESAVFVHVRSIFVKHFKHVTPPIPANLMGLIVGILEKPGGQLLAPLWSETENETAVTTFNLIGDLAALADKSLFEIHSGFKVGPSGKLVSR